VIFPQVLFVLDDICWVSHGSKRLSARAIRVAR
jgi:uncharacterized membrane protein